MTNPQLSSEKVTQTIERLGQRIEDRFPGSGLGGVCQRLLAVSRQAEARSEWIAKPIVGLRVGVWLLLGALALLLGWSLSELRLPNTHPNLLDLVQTLEAATNEFILVGAGIFFLTSLETRVKRRRALHSIHELRSIAHVIDTHQLTKDPERLLERWIIAEHSPPSSMDAFELERYLNYCSEMLSLAGKIAAVYVDDFQDDIALRSAGEAETLSAGLSHKIWQKITILQGMNDEARPA